MNATALRPGSWNIEPETLSEALEARRWMHRHPEVALQEHETTEFIAGKLTDWGIDIIDTASHPLPGAQRAEPLATGIIADIQGSKGPGSTLALRADIDGLPIHEDPGQPYASVNPGVMHACGHDLHTASLLGAARELAQHKDEFRGTVRLLFQPAEEAELGAQKVLASGWLEGVDQIVGYHNHPGLPIGTVGISPKPIMSGNYRFDVVLHGRGAHGSRPDEASDPIAAFTAISAQLQTLVGRSVPALQPAVLSITQVQAGSAWNAIPDQLEFHGTVRAFDNDVAELIHHRVEDTVHSVAATFGVRADVDWTVRAAPIKNDATLALTLAADAQSYANVVDPEPSMGADDFADYQQTGIPGVFAFVGSNGSSDAAGWHTPNYSGLEDMLPYAIQYYLHAVSVVLG